MCKSHCFSLNYGKLKRRIALLAMESHVLIGLPSFDFRSDFKGYIISAAFISIRNMEIGRYEESYVMFCWLYR